MTLTEQFSALDSLLMNTRLYWQCTAFDFDALHWPELHAPLSALSDQAVAELDSDQEQLYQFF